MEVLSLSFLLVLIVRESYYLALNLGVLSSQHLIMDTMLLF